jgi:hypothetical protein
MGSVLIFARITHFSWKECVSTKNADKATSPTPTADASEPPSTNANKANTTTKATVSPLVL